MTDKSDLKALIGHRGEAKQNKMIDKLTTHIVTASSASESIKVLLEILSWYEQRMLQDAKIHAAYASFLRILYEKCDTQEKLDIVFEMYTERLKRLRETNGVPIRRHECERSNQIPSFVWNEAWYFFAEYTAQSLEKCIRWTFYILEQVGLLIQMHYNGVGKEHPDFKRVVIRENTFWYMWKELALSRPTQTGIPTKAWFETLLEGALENPDADRAVRALISNWDEGKRGKLVVYAFEGMSDKTVQAIRHVAEMDEKYRPLLLSKRHTDIIGVLADRSENEREERARISQPIVDWFGQNREAILRLTQEKLDAMKTEAKRLFRPGGYDFVRLRVPPLDDTGILGISFHPEGYRFPDVGIKLVTKMVTTPHLLSYPGRLSEIDKVVHEISDGFVHNRDVIGEILKAVIIDIAYRITTAERHKLKSESNTERDAEDQKEGQSYPVRSCIRHLPPGHKASAEAHLLALEETGMQLPPEITFVASHVRGAVTTYALPTQPFARYSEHDMMNTLLKR